MTQARKDFIEMDTLESPPGQTLPDPVANQIRKIWADTLSKNKKPTETCEVKSEVSPNKSKVAQTTFSQFLDARTSTKHAARLVSNQVNDRNDRQRQGKASTGLLPSKDPNSADHILLGQDAFSVKEKIGEGGMGQVFSADQASLGREIAIKTLESDGGRWRLEDAAFIREALIAGSLSHPNIVPVHFFGRDERGLAYIVMKRVRGKPWSELLSSIQTTGKDSENENATTELSNQLDIFQKVCDATAFAHAHGIIHRDIKPDNVMVGDYGEVTVMDWGLALDISGREDGEKQILPASPTTVAGSPAYMAPEMVLARMDKIGPRTDIYLLGAVLYEILSGRPPHLGNSVYEVLRNAASGEVDRIKLREGYPRDALELERIVRRAMAVEPGDRYEHVGEIQEAVRKFQLRQGDRTESDALAKQARTAYDRLIQKIEGVEDPAPFYPRCTDIIALTRLALKLWGFNPRAIRAQQECLSLYADLAMRGRDWGLAESLLRDLKLTGTNGANLANRQEKLLQEGRDAWQRREMLLRRTARSSALVMVFAVVLSIYLYWTGRSTQDRLDALETSLALGSPSTKASHPPKVPASDPPETGKPSRKKVAESQVKKEGDRNATAALTSTTSISDSKSQDNRPTKDERLLVSDSEPSSSAGARGFRLFEQPKVDPTAEYQPESFKWVGTTRGPGGLWVAWDDSGRAWVWDDKRIDQPRHPMSDRGKWGRITHGAWVDDRRIVLADSEQIVRVGDSPDRPWNIVFRSAQAIRCLAAFSKAGSISVAIASDLDVWVVSDRGGEPRHSRLSSPILDVRFLPSGTLIVITQNKIIQQPLNGDGVEEDLTPPLGKAWLSESGDRLAGIPLEIPRKIVIRSITFQPQVCEFIMEEGIPEQVALSKNGDRIVIAASGGKWMVLDGATANALQHGRSQEPARQLDISADGRTLFLLYESGSIQAIELE